MVEEIPATPPPVPHLEFKATLLLLLFVALVALTVVYLMYARGTFEAPQSLVLTAEDSEGVSVGMDLTFAGFPIGRVRRIELGPDGTARIVIDVPRKDAHWLRQSSVFTLVRNFVGGANLRAYSGVLTDPPLADGAERKVLIGDTGAELPRVVSAARELLQNLTQMSGPESALAGSLANVQALSERAKGPRGAVGVLLGNEADAQRLSAALERVNGLLARVDGIAARADAQMLGPNGVVGESRAAVVQLNGMLGDARATLQRGDAVLAEAPVVAVKARVASTDIGTLRNEVDATLRKVEGLVNELNRKWPFARDAELRLR
jgi:phospholipid/cholesterol/gamma-HCH transport system substrate-binding protein